MKKVNHEFHPRKLNLKKQTVVMLNSFTLGYMNGGTGTNNPDNQNPSSVACNRTGDENDIRCKSKIHNNDTKPQCTN
jgi:hypothetical protein